MSDINELIHAISTAETLAGLVAREDNGFKVDSVTRIREALSTARVRAEEIAISASDLLCDESELDGRLKRAVDAFAAAKVDHPDSIDSIISKTGYVTVILTSPDGKQVIADTDEFIADVIAQHEKAEPLGDRLKRAQIALLEAKLARMRAS